MIDRPGAAHALAIAAFSLAVSVSAAFGQKAPPVATRYVGRLDGGNGVATLTPVGRDTYELSLKVTGSSPDAGSGQVEALAHRRSPTLLVATSGLDGHACKLTLREDGSKLIVHEDGCLDYHGGSVAFEGTLIRVPRQKG